MSRQRRPRQKKAPPKLYAKNDFQTQKSIAATAMSQVQARWLRIIKNIPEASYLAQTAAETSHEDDLLRASLRGYQASSLQTYIRQIENFLTYLAKSQLSLESLTLPQFLDYLWACQDSQQEDRQAFKCKPQAALKALSWFHKKGQIASLSHLCLNPLVQAFSKEDGPSDRREAMPLPLAVLVAWETKIREPGHVQPSESVTISPGFDNAALGCADTMAISASEPGRSPSLYPA